MLGLPGEAEVLSKLTAWAGRDDAIRALILTSSRARADPTVDALSDYDVIVAVPDIAEFLEGDEWVRGCGEPLARWGDRHEVLGLETVFCGVVYADGVKVDYSLWPVELLARVAGATELPDDLDVGYRVLLDKDDAAVGWAAPTFRAHVPAKPSSAVYEALWRGELVFARWALDCDAKAGALRRMLEWRIELDQDWGLRPGAYGRGLERLVPSDVWAELRETYGAVDAEATWEALFRTGALFRRVATEVGDALGYAYPQRVDEAMTSQLEAVREAAQLR